MIYYFQNYYQCKKEILFDSLISQKIEIINTHSISDGIFCLIGKIYCYLYDNINDIEYININHAPILELVVNNNIIVDYKDITDKVLLLK